MKIILAELAFIITYTNIYFKSGLVGSSNEKVLLHPEKLKKMENKMTISNEIRADFPLIRIDKSPIPDYIEHYKIKHLLEDYFNHCITIMQKQYQTFYENNPEVSKQITQLTSCKKG